MPGTLLAEFRNYVPGTSVLGEHDRVFVVLAGEELFLRCLPALENGQEE